MCFLSKAITFQKHDFSDGPGAAFILMFRLDHAVGIPETHRYFLPNTAKEQLNLAL